MKKIMKVGFTSILIGMLFLILLYPTTKASGSPDPEIVSFSIPSTIALGEAADIRIWGRINGDDADEGDLHIAVPDLPDDYADTNHFWIDSYSTANYLYRWPGETCNSGYGQHTATVDYPFAEGYNAPWTTNNGDGYLLVKVKPIQVGSFRIEFKMTAGYYSGGNWFGDPKEDGNETDIKDQQNEYVWIFTIDVIDSEDSGKDLNSDEDSTPGFEALFLILAILMVTIIRKLKT